MRFAVLVLAALVACSPAAPAGGDVAPDELLALAPGEVVLLDVRTPAEYAEGHVAGAVNIPHDALASRVAEVGPTDSRVVVYCKSGRRAGMAAEILGAHGYDDVRLLAGHMDGWKAEGRPIE